MNFKEMLQRDLNEVIFNCNELAEPHRIALQGEEEREIPAILNRNRLDELKMENPYSEEINQASVLLCIQKESIGLRPAIGSFFKLDGKFYRVNYVLEQGLEPAILYEIALQENR